MWYAQCTYIVHYSAVVGAGHKSVNSWFEEKLLTHTANLVIAGEDDEDSNMVIAGEDDEDSNDDAVAGLSVSNFPQVICHQSNWAPAFCKCRNLPVCYVA